MATFALVLPSLIIIMLVSKVLDKVQNNVYIDSIFVVLRPCVVGLIASAGLTVFLLSAVDFDLFLESKQISDLFLWKQTFLFIVLFVLSSKYKKHPIFYLAMAMVAGIALQM